MMELATCAAWHSGMRAMADRGAKMWKVEAFIGEEKFSWDATFLNSKNMAAIAASQGIELAAKSI